MWKANQVRPTRSKKKILFFVSTENFFSRLVCCPQSSLFILIQNGYHTSKSLNTASTLHKAAQTASILQSHSTRLPHFTKPPKQLPHFKATQTASTLQSHSTQLPHFKATQTASTLHKATQTASILQSHPNSFHTSKPPKQLPHFTKPPKQLPHFKATQTASTLHKAYQRNRRTEHDNK